MGIYSNLRSHLLFVDDTALVAEPNEQLQCLSTEFVRMCKGWNLSLNMKKSLTLTVERDEVVLQVEGEIMGNVLKARKLFQDVQDDVTFKVVEGQKPFGVTNRCRDRIV